MRRGAREGALQRLCFCCSGRVGWVALAWSRGRGGGGAGFFTSRSGSSSANGEATDSAAGACRQRGAGGWPRAPHRHSAVQHPHLSLGFFETAAVSLLGEIGFVRVSGGFFPAGKAWTQCNAQR